MRIVALGFQFAFLWRYCESFVSLLVCQPTRCRTHTLASPVHNNSTAVNMLGTLRGWMRIGMIQHLPLRQVLNHSGSHTTAPISNTQVIGVRFSAGPVMLQKHEVKLDSSSLNKHFHVQCPFNLGLHCKVAETCFKKIKLLAGYVHFIGCLWVLLPNKKFVHTQNKRKLTELPEIDMSIFGCSLCYSIATLRSILAIRCVLYPSRFRAHWSELRRRRQNATTLQAVLIWLLYAVVGKT